MYIRNHLKRLIRDYMHSFEGGFEAFSGKRLV